MRERARAEGRSTDLRRPLARARSGRGAGGRRAGDPAQGAARRARPLIEDRVQGEVRFANAQLDDMVLLRSDGTPTYMLSVVVDDHDMGITHIIRGDDHLVNAARQTQLYRALGWPVPAFAHIPLIHGPDGAKLSKRHGALGVDAYREMGYSAGGAPQLPAAARLEPWRRRGDRAPSRRSRGSISMRSAGARRASTWPSSTTSTRIICARLDDAELARLIAPRLAAAGHRIDAAARAPPDRRHGRAQAARDHPGRSGRARQLLCCGAAAGAERQGGAAARPGGPRAARRAGCRRWPGRRTGSPRRSSRWCARTPRRMGVKLGQLAQPLRAALTGSDASPGIFEVMAVLGRDEVLGRIADAVGAPCRSAT